MADNPFAAAAKAGGPPNTRKRRPVYKPTAAEKRIEKAYGPAPKKPSTKKPSTKKPTFDLSALPKHPSTKSRKSRKSNPPPKTKPKPIRVIPGTGFVTRGDLATALHKLVGVEETSRNRFTDAGGHAVAASTLADLGILDGVDDDSFAPTDLTNRGDLFLALAKMLGLSTPRTTPEQAAAMLEDRGIIMSMSGDPRIGEPIDQPLLTKILAKVSPELDEAGDTGQTPRDYLNDTADIARDAALSSEDEVFSAYLQAQGLRRDQIREEIARRRGTMALDNKVREDQYARAAEQARRSINQDYLSRGLYGAAGRQATLGRSNDDYAAAMEDAAYEARKNYEDWRTGQEYELQQIEGGIGSERLRAQSRQKQRQIDDRHLS